MAPKSKKTQSSLEKYKNMTLEELSNLDDANDEEINEEEAFNTEDEKVYGKCFSSSERKVRSTNLSLPIPLEDKTVRIVEIAKGSKMTLSSVCLDVPTFDFDVVKLMYRCIYPDQIKDQVGDFCCLCNYLSAKKGGMGLIPSTPLNLEVVGPCKVEFRSDISPGFMMGGAINIFGVIVPEDHSIADDVSYTFMPLEEEIESEKEGVAISASVSDSKNGNADDASNGTASKGTKKRKLEKEPSKQPATAESIAPANLPSSDKKLTKKQRKRLAEEKAKQLEETLSAARGETNDDDANNTESPAKKKSKKKQKKQLLAETDTRSVTRERRIAGGLVVSDILLGAGTPVKPGKKISLHYTGSLRSTGKVFDKNNSKQHPLVFRQGTGEVIRGLERGLEGMKMGGERIITIPSKLGYGAKGAGVDIPPDSDLVFEVKVLKVG